MKNSNLPAFASSAMTDRSGYQQDGLTKREYFAGLAMQSYASGEFTGQSGMPHEVIAEWSVKMADALLKQLEL